MSRPVVEQVYDRPVRQYRFRPVSKPGWVTSWDTCTEPEPDDVDGDWDQAAQALVDEVNAQVSRTARVGSPRGRRASRHALIGTWSRRWGLLDQVPLNVTVLIDAAGVAHVPGYGIVSSWTVEGLADLTAGTGGRLTTITQDPVRCPGEHPNGGRDDPHDPPAAMRRTVQTRNPICVFPGCVTVATRCDLDHTTPWPHGPTCPCNLGPLCRRHHRLKTHDPGWHLTNHNNGTFTWTTPSGQTYTITP